jgi:hypothetical protein
MKNQAWRVLVPGFAPTKQFEKWRLPDGDLMAIKLRNTECLGGEDVACDTQQALISASASL